MAVEYLKGVGNLWVQFRSKRIRAMKFSKLGGLGPLGARIAL